MAAAQIINGRHRAEGDQLNAWAPDPRRPGARTGSSCAGPSRSRSTWSTCRSRPRPWLRSGLPSKPGRTATWRRIAEVAQNRHRRHVLGLDRQTSSKLRIVLDEPRGICEVRVYDEPDRLVAVARRAQQNMRLPDAGPWLPWDQGKPPNSRDRAP